MKMINRTYVVILLVSFFVAARPTEVKSQVTTPEYQRTVSKELYDSIAALDSIFFNAYNNCNLKILDSLLSEDLEFYHDKGGLSTSKKEIMKALENNICGKVTRELLKGSIEVYQIKDFGAIEMGFHGFHNNQEKESGPTHFSKFVHIWHRVNDQWKLTRVISLH
jgi:ketosteroid isomerase-like protein